MTTAEFVRELDGFDPEAVNAELERAGKLIVAKDKHSNHWTVGRKNKLGRVEKVPGVPWFSNRADAQEAWLDLLHMEAMTK